MTTNFIRLKNFLTEARLFLPADQYVSTITSDNLQGEELHRRRRGDPHFSRTTSQEEMQQGDLDKTGFTRQGPHQTTIIRCLL